MGKVYLCGKVPKLEVPFSGIAASEIAVGSTVKLMENGVAVDYLVVHKGVPSTMYDSSCNGLWLLRKDIFETRAWHSSNSNSYKASTIHSYLNSTFLARFDDDTQAAINQAKIPYVNGTASSSVASGANGLSAKIFLLAGYELGWTKSNNAYFPADGSCLTYFSGTAQTDSKRIGYLNGTATKWWLRSPYTYNVGSAWCVGLTGVDSGDYCSVVLGIRPALILPNNAVFDANTLTFKGVS